MTKSLVVAAALLTAPFALAACDAPSDEPDVVSKQLQDADLPIEDALSAVDEAAPDAIVIEAEFQSGVDAGYYEVLAIEGEDLIVFEVEASRPAVAFEVERRRADEERLARARRHRHLRRRLAAALADMTDRRAGERIRLARLLPSEIVVELLDRRGNARRIRQALAD